MENDSINISFIEIAKKLRRHKLTPIISISLSLFLALIYNQLATPIYRASAIVSFERFSKDGMLEFDFSSSRYQDYFIANRVEEIKTTNFASKVYQKSPDHITHQIIESVNREQTGLMARVREWLKLRVNALLGSPAMQPRSLGLESLAINKIEKGLSVIHSDNTPGILTISFDARSPEIAQTVTNTTIQTLRESDVEFRRKESANLMGFIDEQIAVVEKKLKNSEDALSKFKSAGNITSVADESREIHRRITDAENLYNKIKNDKGAKQQKLDLLNAKLSEQQDNLTKSVTEPSRPLIIKLRERLIELEVQLANLRVQNYAEDHPRAVELKSEIDLAKKNVVDMTMSIFQDKNFGGITNPLSYLEESISLELEVQVLGAQETHLKNTLNSYDTRLKNLSIKDATLFGLLREREVNNKNYVRLLEEREQARLREAADIGNIHMIEQAEKPLMPYKPRKRLNIIIAVFLGTLIGLWVLFFRLSLNDAFDTPEELEKALNTPVLASIPKVKPRETTLQDANLVNNLSAATPYHDAFSCLWSCVRGLNSGNLSSLLVTSSFPEEGKSTVAVQLACIAARLGKKTVLVDGDARKPSLHKIFNLNNEHGLTNLISKAMSISDAVSFSNTTNDSFDSLFRLCENDTNESGKKPWDDKPQDLNASEIQSIIQAEVMNETRLALSSAPMENLAVLTAGNAVIQSDVLWNSPVMGVILKSLQEKSDFMIIDMPPVLGISDAIFAAAHVDGVLLCVEADKTDKKTLLRTQKFLQHTNCNLYGIIFNKVNPLSIYGTNKYQKYYKDQSLIRQYAT